MDVSYTMAFDLDTIIGVAEEMARNMQKLTENFRLALGVYTDKTAVPFAYTTEREINEHCQSRDNSITCSPSFDFKHKMNFTGNISEFIEQVKLVKNQTTINIDEPEGGLDALMQTILCQDEMGWNVDSRKVVLVATDATLHLAGEGKLIGAVRRNTAGCLLDKQGNYFSSLEYDYPSVEEINRKLIEMKVGGSANISEPNSEVFVNPNAILRNGNAICGVGAIRPLNTSKSVVLNNPLKFFVQTDNFQNSSTTFDLQ